MLSIIDGTALWTVGVFENGFLKFWHYSGFSKESNTISYQTIVSQNWCILSKDDEYVKFSFFSEVYDGSILATSELKTELPELR